MPVPVEGEWFPSWVDRCAQVLSVSPAAMVRHLGLEVQGGAEPSPRPRFYGLLLTRSSLANLVTATGLDPAVLVGMQLKVFDQVALDLSGLDDGDERTVQRVAHHVWLQLRTARGCPACLAERPVWMRWWQLGVAAVCPLHRAVLRSHCTACARPIGRSGRASGLRSVRAVSLASCTNRTPTGPCGGDLRHPTRPASPTEVGAQQSVLDVIARGEGTVGGSPVASLTWFDALAGVARLVRMADAYDRARTPHSYGRSPATAEEAADLLAVCVPAITSGRMPDRLAPLAAQTRFPIVLASSGLPPGLVAGWCTPRRRQAPTATVAARLRGAVPAVDASRLPQAVPLGMYTTALSSLVPGTAPSTGRVFAAIAAARLVLDASWSRAGATLGLGEERTRAVTGVVPRRIGDLDAFWDEIRRLCHALAVLDVDFARRRRRFGHPGAVDAAAWVALSDPYGLTFTVARARSASAWVWEHVAGGDPSTPPAWTDAMASRASCVEAYRRFQQRTPVGLLRDLEAWATTIVTSDGH